jgi:signal transduction histidine kinase
VCRTSWAAARRSWAQRRRATAIPHTSSSKALIFAPHGRDAAIAASLLNEAAIAAATCPTLAAFQQALGDDVGFAVVTEEVLLTAGFQGIALWVEAQPSWSDLAFIILTRRGGGPERNPAAARLSEALGNVTFLERPFHPTTFISVARTALKGRYRQHEARTRMEELRHLNETLEERVAERTAEFEQAHRHVLEEIAQREHAERQLRQAQKMEMIGQLTGGVAHDFNNLLMAILGNLDLLRKHIPADPRSTRLIEGASQGARRGAALTQRLLAFARRQDLKIEPRNLVELVNGMTDLLKRSLGPRIALCLDLPPSLPLALVDGNQLELALLNLAVNARDAMPDGGTLTIALDSAEAPAGSELAPGRYLCLTVSDTGHGMDAATLARATEPFFSTKEVGKGTGLGLSMIQGLAQQLSGTLRLSSEVGRGTTAELWLPVTTATAASEPVAPAAVEAAPACRATILVVDDDALIAMSTADMLEDLGHEVIETNSGEDALEILRHPRPIDLMITDYAMPKMTGAQLADAARALRPHLPILLATGYAELPTGSALDLPRLGKPYHQAQLAAEIGKLLAPKDS